MLIWKPGLWLLKNIKTVIWIWYAQIGSRSRGYHSGDVKFSLTFLIPETIAFHTVLTSYTEILEEAPVLFNEILINEGDG